MKRQKVPSIRGKDTLFETHRFARWAAPWIGKDRHDSAVAPTWYKNWIGKLFGFLQLLLNSRAFIRTCQRCFIQGIKNESNPMYRGPQSKVRWFQGPDVFDACGFAAWRRQQVRPGNRWQKYCCRSCAEAMVWRNWPPKFNIIYQNGAERLDAQLRGIRAGDERGRPGSQARPNVSVKTWISPANRLCGARETSSTRSTYVYQSSVWYIGCRTTRSAFSISVGSTT